MSTTSALRHWADPTTLNLLRGIAESGALAPLFILITAGGKVPRHVQDFQSAQHIMSTSRQVPARSTPKRTTEITPGLVVAHG